MKNNKKMLAKMEVKNKLYGTPQYKSQMIHTWKRSGIIHDDFDTLFEEYIATTACQHCGKDFTSTRDRHIDHDHNTGQVRLIVCQKCNVNDSYINWPDGWDRQKYIADYRRENKERIVERDAKYRRQNRERIAEKIKCECGAVVRRDGLAPHRRTNKHIENI
jgi:hypothetical protein